MLPTPDTSHIDFSNVYEPSEDSFLLLDALSQDSEVRFLSNRFKNITCPLVLEVGSGSGVVLAFIAANARAIVDKSHILALSTDLNAFACRATARTVQHGVASAVDLASGVKQARNGAVFLDAVNASLTSSIVPRSVDLLIFNPPYVPSENVPRLAFEEPTDQQQHLSRSTKFERDCRLLALATDGGEDGMEVTYALLAQLPEVLNPRTGVAYILLCARNRPEEVKSRIAGWGSSWKVNTVRTSGMQGGWEKLQIIRIERASS